MSTRDGWRLAVGTLTAIPTRPPTRVDTAVAGRAMLLAPLASMPLVAIWVGFGLVCGWLTRLLTPSGTVGLPWICALLAVAGIALATRALHLDGLADLADGLSASHDRDRALAVMKTGDVGPSGVVALVVVLGLQTAATATLYTQAVLHTGVLGLGVTALLTSRLALTVACRRGIPAATPHGLGATVAGTVSTPAALLACALVALGGALLAGLLGLPWWAGAPAGVIIVGVGALATVAVVRRARTRLGGITGDVLGAAVEITLAAGLITALLCAALLTP